MVRAGTSRKDNPMQTTLSRLRSWAFDNKNEDIRGWSVLAPDGHAIGTVDELIVDTNTHHVTQIVTGEGRHFSAHDLIIGDHTLTVANGKPKAKAVAAAALPATTPPEKKPVTKVEPLKQVASTPAKILTTAPDMADIVIPIIREEIEVGTRRIDTGGLRVESRVVAKPFDRDLRLREEQVKFERRKVDETLPPDQANQRFRDGAVEVSARSEYPIIKKRSHIVEEVIVTRAGSDRAVPLRDTLRHTEIDVNQIPPGKVPGVEGNVAAKGKSTGPARAKNGSVVIPIVDEEMVVDKGEYDAGGVRVVTHVTSEPIEKTVRVHEEHITVERNVVDKPLDTVEDAFLDRAFDMPTFKEEPLLTKRARVVEELRIHKVANERVEHIHDTLRHTNVNVTQLPVKGGSMRALYEDHFKRNYLDKGYKYEALVPVYEYGAELRRTMGNRDWAAVEPEGKRIWEAKNPGTWDKFVLAVRHGWENLKH